MQEGTQPMDEFLASVERRAFHIARIATGNTEEALDIVQETMLALVRGYANKPQEEWRPLFFRILQNKIRDGFRRNTVRRVLFGWWEKRREADDNPVDQLASPAGESQGDLLMRPDGTGALDAALRSLPHRQQQAFLLRAWEEMSVQETAAAMQCSEGSVKTHYSRAVQALRVKLGDFKND